MRDARTIASVDEFRGWCNQLETSRGAFTRLKVIVERVIISRTPQVAVPTLQGSAATSRASSPESTRSRTRYPELTIPTFSGKPTEWLSFWSSFGTIHSDPELTADQKLRYLIKYLAGEAAETIKGYRVTEASYAPAVQQLEERYGRTDLIATEHMLALQKLKRVEKRTDAVGLRTLYTQTQIHIRCLESLGRASSSYATFLAPILLRKLPQKMQLTWYSEPTHTSDDLEGILKMLKREVEAQERFQGGQDSGAIEDTCASTAVASSSTSNRGARTATAVALTTGSTERVCVFRSERNHTSFNCTLGVTERRKAAMNQRLCLNCLKGGHGFRDCPSKSSCRKCAKRHHTSIHDPSGQQREPAAPGTSGSAAQATKPETPAQRAVGQSFTAGAAVNRAPTGE